MSVLNHKGDGYELTDNEQRRLAEIDKRLKMLLPADDFQHIASVTPANETSICQVRHCWLDSHQPDKLLRCWICTAAAWVKKKNENVCSTYVNLAVVFGMDMEMNNYSTWNWCGPNNMSPALSQYGAPGCLYMVALCNRADHYIFALWFLSFFLFFPRLISAAIDWMSTILRHMMWP